MHCISWLFPSLCDTSQNVGMIETESVILTGFFVHVIIISGDLNSSPIFLLEEKFLKIIT